MAIFFYHWLSRDWKIVYYKHDNKYSFSKIATLPYCSTYRRCSPECWWNYNPFRITVHISSTHAGFLIQAYIDNKLRTSLKKIDTIIIEEISMVFAELLDFISNMFANLHNNALAFSRINVIVVGDLAQLPPINGQPVFRAAVWSLFYPLFLRSPQRQNNDTEFYSMLEEVRSGNISEETWNKLQQRHAEYLVQTPVDSLLNTTHIVGFRENAQQINRMICNHLPVSENKFLISQAVDFMNSV